MDHFAMDIYEIRRANLRTLIDERFGGKIAALAEAIERAPSYVSRCVTEKPEHRKRIGEGIARDIELKLGLPLLSLDYPKHHSEMSNVAPMLQPHRGPRKYPLISWVAAGERAESPDIFALGDADEWLESTEVAGQHGYWLEVKGQSMISNSTPSFAPGMAILVQPEGFELISGKFYVFKHISGETTFKQYIYDAGTAYIAPLNPTFRTVEMDEEWTAIGRVVDAKIRGL